MILPEEQKGCRKKSRGTGDLLYIDKMVLKEAKRRKKNLAMAWIDYRKAYDMLPHSWMLECLKDLGVNEEIVIGRNDEILEGGVILCTRSTWRS